MSHLVPQRHVSHISSVSSDTKRARFLEITARAERPSGAAQTQLTSRPRNRQALAVSAIAITDGIHLRPVQDDLADPGFLLDVIVYCICILESSRGAPIAFIGIACGDRPTRKRACVAKGAFHGRHIGLGRDSAFRVAAAICSYRSASALMSTYGCVRRAGPANWQSSLRENGRPARD
jgi:hypothetical protein